MAQAVVVVLTGEEHVSLREDLRQTGNTRDALSERQARPNVLFEAGLAFGRHPDRTILVQIGGHREFTDTSGRNYIAYDGSFEMRDALKNRLEDAHCAVNPHGSEWLQAGADSLRASLGAVVPGQPKPAQEADRAHHRWLNRFAGIACDVGGIETYLAWDGPLDELQTREPRTTTPAEMGSVYEAICQHVSEPLQPMWEFVESAKGREVYETDADRTWKRKLRSPDPRDARSFLRVIGRKDPCSSYCPLCGRISGGDMCAACATRVGRPVLLKTPGQPRE